MAFNAVPFFICMFVFSHFAAHFMAIHRPIDFLRRSKPPINHSHLRVKQKNQMKFIIIVLNDRDREKERKRERMSEHINRLLTFQPHLMHHCRIKIIIIIIM